MSPEAISSVQIDGKTFIPLEENEKQNEVISPTPNPGLGVDETSDPKRNIPLVGGIKGEKLNDSEIATYMHAFVIFLVAGLFYGVGRGIAAVASLFG